jgi:hypothetical protein
MALQHPQTMSVKASFQLEENDTQHRYTYVGVSASKPEFCTLIRLFRFLAATLQSRTIYNSGEKVTTQVSRKLAKSQAIR